MSAKKPFEIAREALIMLAGRKLAPTPDNYQSVFNEITGTPHATPFPVDEMRRLLDALPLRHAHRTQFERAVAEADWNAVRATLAGVLSAAERPAAADARAAVPPADLNEQCARLIENALPAFSGHDARFDEQAHELVKLLRSPHAEAAALKTALANFAHRLSFAAEDQAEVRASLLKQLNALIANIGQVNSDDPWLGRQVSALLEAAAPPLSLRRLDDIDRRLKDVMFRQVEAKGRMVEAQQAMREMLATFVERLAQMTEKTSTYHDTMERSARMLDEARSLEDIAPVLKDVIASTRGIAYEMQAVRDELRGMREQVAAREAEVVRLREKLDSASTEARHDALTGALNRKGLDEALTREFADVRRRETPLCMALLDIDNFKKLNDSMGHAAGDAALTHLVEVTRESMRVQDTLARYGGEEFVIVMPDTGLDQGIEAMTRLQRALTRRFFLSGGEKILITFSAGVAQVAPGETPEAAIERADRAMYLAKRAGKNRVLGA